MASMTYTSHATAYTTTGGINGSRYKNAVGKTSSTTVSGNDYASSSGNTATITYSFNFSSIPAGSRIESVSVVVGGHCENTSKSTATLQLYANTTAKGSQAKFTSTSHQAVTMTPGTWTRDELQNAKLTFTMGYYGGVIGGIDFTVTYSTKNFGSVRIGGAWKEIDNMWVRIGGAWKEVDSIYTRIGGAWKSQ